MSLCLLGFWDLSRPSAFSGPCIQGFPSRAAQRCCSMSASQDGRRRWRSEAWRFWASPLSRDTRGHAPSGQLAQTHWLSAPSTLFASLRSCLPPAHPDQSLGSPITGGKQPSPLGGTGESKGGFEWCRSRVYSALRQVQVYSPPGLLPSGLREAPWSKPASPHNHRVFFSNLKTMDFFPP